jgi:RNA 2',3'-cyclic 3'-phosphodiesterase
LRLFVAVDLDETLRRAAARVTRALRDRLERAETYGISWVTPDNMHLTLRFLGEMGDDLARQVEETLRLPLAAGPFDIELAGLGTFPPTGSARVIWLGIVNGGDGLARLHEEVAARLRALPFEREGRPYRAHLTIGRFRVPAPARVRETVTSTEVGAIGRCTIRHVTLYRSQLSPKGAIYTPLVRTPLSGVTS